MKWNSLAGRVGIIAALLACLVAAHGDGAVSSTPFIALSGVSVPEIPAKAAELVNAAAASNRKQTAEEVLRAVAVIAKPGVLRYVVSAICASKPEVAGVAVATAIELQPEGVVVSCQAAVCAAPGQVEQIVFSACKAAPASCAAIAGLAYHEVPSAKETILTELARAMPELELYLEEAQMKAGTNGFQAVLEQTVQLYNDASKARSK